MSAMMLEATDLVDALNSFGDRYHAVDVFADDLSPAAKEAVKRGTLESKGQSYVFKVFVSEGVVRLERTSASGVSTAAITGAVIGAAIAAANKQKGEGILGGALLGLLVGGFVGSLPAPNASGQARRVFAMQFDPRQSQWQAYEGDLLRWMKSRLLVSGEGSK
jgi:hypothetical protein